LRWLFDCCPRVHPGTKILLEQLAPHRLRVTDLVRSFPDARWIVLYRRSLTSQYVSLKRAQGSGNFVARVAASSVESTKVSLTADELRRYCRDTRALYTDMLRELEPYHPLVLDYESLSQSPQRVFDERVWGFLGLAPVAVATRLRRQSRDSLEQSLLEFESLRELIESDETRLELSDGRSGAPAVP